MNRKFESLMSNRRRILAALRALGIPEAYACETRISDAVYALQERQAACETAAAELTMLRKQARWALTNSTRVIDAFLCLLGSLDGDLFRRIAHDVDSPTFDAVTFGCELPQRCGDEAALLPFANAVGTACVKARDLTTATNEKVTANDRLSVDEKRASFEAQVALKEAELLVRSRTSPDSKARQLLKSSRRKNPKSTAEAVPASAPVTAGTAGEEPR